MINKTYTLYNTVIDVFFDDSLLSRIDFYLDIESYLWRLESATISIRDKFNKNEVIKYVSLNIKQIHLEYTELPSFKNYLDILYVVSEVASYHSPDGLTDSSDIHESNYRLEHILPEARLVDDSEKKKWSEDYRNT